MAEETVKLLKGVPLFSRFSDRQLGAIHKTAKEREFEPGTPIVREGDQSNLGFYLILDGQVEVRKGNQTLAKLGSGQFFGEMSLLDDQPRSADVVPMTKTKCLVLTRWDIKGLIKTYPDIAMTMLEELARRLRETDKALSE
ncbi:MAG: cyclic nucleotide-binding domain-containing protein [Candidatus Acetothermia bacterium]|jgi:CRP-like cAMP-binding protein|nr:cyclic nucleotide-binding domain-containing protein [Candidatus Acetothermia bacterium]MDH7505498.1 cyclic nucleotide-binding domain-containing protein [Candidatus Acetothermia bacterium]